MAHWCNFSAKVLLQYDCNETFEQYLNFYDSAKYLTVDERTIIQCSKSGRKVAMCAERGGWNLSPSRNKVK